MSTEDQTWDGYGNIFLPTQTPIQYSNGMALDMKDSWADYSYYTPHKMFLNPNNYS